MSSVNLSGKMMHPGQRWKPWRRRQQPHQHRPILVASVDEHYKDRIPVTNIAFKRTLPVDSSSEELDKEFEICIAWLNESLEFRKMKIKDSKDAAKYLHDGISLARLIQNLDGVKIPIAWRPIFKSQRVSNSEKCLAYLRDKAICIGAYQWRQIGIGNKREIAIFLRNLRESFSKDETVKNPDSVFNVNVRSHLAPSSNFTQTTPQIFSPKILQKSAINSGRSAFSLSGFATRHNRSGVGRAVKKCRSSDWDFISPFCDCRREMSLGRYYRKGHSMHTGNMSHFDSEGRRQIFGLSKAIRKHAYQSTSPSSEFKYGRKEYKSQDAIHSKHIVKNAPTIEDRLRSLLNSDTEGPEGASSSGSKRNPDNLPTYELASKGSQGSYSPRIAESKMMAQRLNRTTGDEPANVPGNWLGRRTRSSSIEQIQTQTGSYTPAQVTPKSPGPCVRRSQTEALNARQRRCVSAIPTSFYDENWNVVPDKQTLPRAGQQYSERNPVAPNTPLTALGRKTPINAYNQAVWDQRPPPSPIRTTPLPQESTPNDRDPAPAWMAVRGSSDQKNAGTSSSGPRKTLEYTLSSVPMAAKEKCQNKQSDTMRLFRFRRPAESPESKANKENQNAATGPISTVLDSEQHGNTVERKARAIQYTHPPSPARRRPLTIDCSALVNDNNAAGTPSPSKHAIESKPPVPAQRTTSRQRNQTAAAARKEACKTPDVEIIENPDKSASPHPLDDELESRKSEDRDSGAILDAEASVFDFDSSVMSESEDEATQDSNKIKKQNASPEQTQNGHIWSRSSTPTLPPLSPYETDDETPRNSEVQPEPNCTQNQSPGPYHNEVACLPSYHSLLKKKKSSFSSDATKEGDTKDEEKYDCQHHDHHELSPTESALAEPCRRQKEVAPVKVMTKVVSSKVLRAGQISRHSSHASSLDDRRLRAHRVAKRHNHHGHKRHNRKNTDQLVYYDDIDGPDARESTSKQNRKFGLNPVFYRPSSEEPMLEQNGTVETSSVRSFTSASVTSSARRKSHRRHHRRHGVLDKAYAKEVKAVNKRFTRLEAHVVTLARSVAQLSSEMRMHNSTTRDIEELRGQMEELRRDRNPNDPPSRKSSSSRKSDVPRAALNAKAHPRRVVKLTKFFGERPPLLNLFLSKLGYEKYIDNFNAESIGMIELPYMDEDRLKSIGIPLGPRMRILKEARKTSFV